MRKTLVCLFPLKAIREIICKPEKTIYKMKTPSNELQELIRTMSSREKTEFKLYCQKKRDSEKVEYIKLFTIYCNTNEQNDNQIKRQHQFRNFTRIKNYLHQQLLNYLAETASPTIDKELNNLLILSDVLIKRALYKQGISILNKARNIAKKLERYHYCLMIDQKIYFAQNTIRNFDFWGYYINDYLKQEFQPMVEKLTREQEIQCFGAKVNRSMVKQDYLIRTKEALHELEGTCLPLLQKGDDYAQTFISKIQYYNTAGYFHDQHNQFEEASMYYEKAVELYENSPEFHSTRYMTYVMCLNNLLNSYALAHNLTALKTNLGKLNGIQAKDKSHKIVLQQVSWLYEIILCKFSADQSFRKRSIKRIEAEFIRQYSQVLIPSRIKISLNLSVNFFIEANYKKSLEWLNKMDEFSSNVNYKSFFAVSRLYRLVLYYEMEKYDLLQYSISNTYRSLQHSKLLFKLEKVVIKTLEKLIDQNNARQREKILKNALEELEPIQGDITLFHVLNIFDFIAWIRSKLSGDEFRNFIAVPSDFSEPAYTIK